MAYIDCPCYSCTDRAIGTKRVACHPDCKRFLDWKVKQQRAREKKRKDRPYRSETMAKSIKRKQMNQKAGRR
jgi:hypothetical protein|uniref:Uncharacterized protein n=1 Tax=Siphoviridae sp. ctX926 TaxID=2826366 RepID=A0A8S5M196_9CAUD|nr:MAG TPA: hypothetical protein [Siphoviridae sp. ctX926]